MPYLHSFETNAALAEHNTGMFKRRNDLSLSFLGARQGAGHAFEAACLKFGLALCDPLYENFGVSRGLTTRR
jgi:hypothetical protein